MHGTRRTTALLLAAVLLALAAAGCAKRTQIQQVSADEIRGRLKHDNVAVRSFVLAPDLSGNPVAEAALSTSQASTIDYLQKKEVFRSVSKLDVAPTEGETLLLDCAVKELRIVSGAARVWGGVLAGRSHMTVHVTLTDAATGSLVHEQDLMGAPGAYGAAWSGGARDQGLPWEMGKLIGDYVLLNAPKK